MPPLDFPASPTVGQTYPSPPVTGIPTYKWDGAEWLSAFALGKEMVPLDGSQPMTGLLTLSGNPVDPLHAVPKQFLSDPAARPLVYAAPFDAMAYNGMQVNGSMEVSQELGTTSRITNGYVCDGWTVNASGTVVLNSQSANTAGLPGFTRSLSIVVSTAQPSLGAPDVNAIETSIEGYRVSRLGWGSVSAQSITLGFWTSHHRIGTYSVAARNGAFNRACVVTYTQNVADTWEYKTVTIPGCVDGSWDISNGAGLRLTFTFACGTTYTAPTAGVWSSVAPYVAAPGQVNGVGATSDVFRLTGVVVLPGIEAPSAARSPLIMRPYDQELVTCMRYWEFASGQGFGFSGGVTSGQTYTAYGRWRVSKRSAPTFIAVNLANGNFPAAAGSLTVDVDAFHENRVANATGASGWFQTNVYADARL